MEHSPLVFGVETALWPMAAKKAGKWYRVVLEAAERFMVRWHQQNLIGSATHPLRVPSKGMGREGARVVGKGNRGRRKQEGDGRQGSTVPGQLVGTTCLCHSYGKLRRLLRV